MKKFKENKTFILELFSSSYALHKRRRLLYCLHSSCFIYVPLEDDSDGVLVQTILWHMSAIEVHFSYEMTLT